MSRPEALGAVLDIVNETERIDEELYCRFLRYAEIARSNAFHSRLSISASFRYSSLSDEAADDKGNHNKTNGSLLEIFKYYAKLEPPNLVQVTTFTEVSVSNDTLSIIEFITFLRDFRVIPRLLTKREVRQVWGTIANDFVASGQGTFKKMDLEVFKDAIARLAVCAFCKPGLKNLLAKVNGFEITPRHAVEYFSRYLHLPDERWVRNHISIAGKESQGARNYRSMGDFDVKAMLDNLEDMATDKLVKKSSTKSKKPKKIVTSIPQKRYEQPAPWPSNPAKSLLPEKMKIQLYPEAFHDGKWILPEDSKNCSAQLSSRERAAQKASKKGDSDDDGGDEEELSDDSGEDGAEEGPAGEGGGPTETGEVSDSIEKILERFYDFSLVGMIKRYCRYQPKRVNSRTIYSEGAFLDMGLVPSGAQCGVRLTITNKSPEDIYFDVSIRDMDCSDVFVTTHAAMLIPGLPRVVDISFTMDSGATSVIGYIDVHSYCAKSGSVVALSCPVYYRVGSFVDENRQICTDQNLTGLVAKYCKSKKSFAHNLSEFQPIPRCLTKPHQVGMDSWIGSPAQAIRAWRRNQAKGIGGVTSSTSLLHNRSCGESSGIADESTSRPPTAPSSTVLTTKVRLPPRMSLHKGPQSS